MNNWLLLSEQRDDLQFWLGWLWQERRFREACGDTWRADCRECDSTTTAEEVGGDESSS